MIRQAWLTLPSCFANSSTPTLLRMIFSSLVIVSSPRSDTECLRSETTPPPAQPVRFHLNEYSLRLRRRRPYGSRRRSRPVHHPDEARPDVRSEGQDRVARARGRAPLL